ncbi:lysozyme inhibitor LprI family protein [Telluria mixta]|uniref:Lysozyme inhibitor LprI family protein n=1 Tax=Telluria mixta TaxID=34071 RepID=A0ABT2C3W8_9BURK|nr:lysozyme inhibitor LprI family protein [Telluria mixta]MCS0631892.1 lysozyme inhibitor LprI family protein [Telluria mixta]WEM95424.1 lysozyme inhibitor LprI family protein [Telluria mixta]
MTIRSSLAALACLGLFFTHAARADTDIAGQKHERCEDAGLMIEISACMHLELAESDARLDLVYTLLRNALARPDGLARAQRAWHAYRDAQCTFENEGLEGGSAQPFSTDLCRTRLAERRIAELEEVMPCNGCVEFKSEYYGIGKGFVLPRRSPGKPARR